MNVITVGTFEILHYGHIKLFDRCLDLAGDGLFTIGLNTDEFIEKYKGFKPVMNYGEREKALEYFSDNIIANSQKSGGIKDILNDIDLIVIGSDWARKDYLSQIGLDWDWLDERGIGICYLNYTHGISTTEIKKRICKK